jgi:hypothetical protein
VLPATQKFVWTNPEKLLMQFHQNSREIINTMSSCASHQHFLVHRFLSEFLPFHDFNFEICPDYYYSTTAISMKLNRIY